MAGRIAHIPENKMRDTESTTLRDGLISTFSALEKYPLWLPWHQRLHCSAPTSLYRYQDN